MNLDTGSEIMTTMRHKIQESERIIKGLENEVILKNNLVNVLK